MQKKHNCICCNYATDKLSSYKKHLQTKKHQRNSSKIPKFRLSKTDVVPSKTDSETSKMDGISSSSDEEDSFVCEYCKKTFKFRNNKSRHYNRCKDKRAVEKELELNMLMAKYKELEEANKRLENEREKIEKEKEMINKEKEEYQKEYMEIIKCFKEGVLKQVVVNNNDNRTYNQVFIMNNFNDAYNFDDLMNKPLTMDEIKMIKNEGAVVATCKLLKTRCIDNIELEKRPIHCTDKTRRKILLRNNDEWKIDFGGKQTLQKTYPLVRSVYKLDSKTVPIKKLIFNSEQLLAMETNDNKIIDYVIDDIMIKNNRAKLITGQIQE